MLNRTFMLLMLVFGSLLCDSVIAYRALARFPTSFLGAMLSLICVMTPKHAVRVCLFSLLSSQCSYFSHRFRFLLLLRRLIFWVITAVVVVEEAV